MLSRTFAIALAAFLATAPAIADDAMPDNAGGRFAFSKVTDGIVRLDTQTGQVSLCSPRTVGWACLTAPEDRAALENEIDRLRAENAALKRDLLLRGLPLPPGAMPEPPAAHSNDITIQLPDDAQIDHALAYMSDMWRRFVDTIAKAQKQMMNRT